VIKAVKHWRNGVQWRQLAYRPNSYLLSLLVIKAAQHIRSSVIHYFIQTIRQSIRYVVFLGLMCFLNKLMMTLCIILRYVIFHHHRHRLVSNHLTSLFLTAEIMNSCSNALRLLICCVQSRRRFVRSVEDFIHNNDNSSNNIHADSSSSSSSSRIIMLL